MSTNLYICALMF